MGNQPSSNSGSSDRRRNDAAERVKKMMGDVQAEIKRSVKKLDEDHPAAQLFDQMCGSGYNYDDEPSQASSKYYRRRSYYDDDDYTEDGSRTVSEDDTTYVDDRSRRSRADQTVDTQSYMSQSDNDSDHRHDGKRKSSRRPSFDTEDERTEASSYMGAPVPVTNPTTALQKQPLASSFAKRCYFTKSGIGRTTQHYEGLTLTGNVVLMLASAMKLKGCPTICDEDLRRVEQTYPNQFSRLPDELLLSSGWRRISKYCHFSNKPIPDGIPFFHSKQRLHPSGGYYFLLASAVGMTRPMDVEPLNRDTLVLLETDFPTQCDAAPSVLVRDPEQWMLVEKFCFFSGGPINTEEDVYYQADFDGNPIYMLAFLSPSLTPDELYKLGETGDPSLKTVTAVQEVESVYDLTERDFDDLKLYHLGPCRALPPYILQPQAWIKILPPHFLAARQQAMIRAEEYMQRHGIPMDDVNVYFAEHEPQEYPETEADNAGAAQFFQDPEFEQVENKQNDAAYDEAGIPMDEAEGALPSVDFSPGRKQLSASHTVDENLVYKDPMTPKLDPPEDEPPSLQKSPIEENQYQKKQLSPDAVVPIRSDEEDTTSLHDGAKGGGQESTALSAASSPSRPYYSAHQHLTVQLEEKINTPDDEQESTNLINLDSVEENLTTQYDPFLNDVQTEEQSARIDFDEHIPVEASRQAPSHLQRPTLDPIHTRRTSTEHTNMFSPTQHEQMEDTEHLSQLPPDHDYYGEEKKIGIIEQHATDEHRRILNTESQDSGMRTGEEDFIPIKRDSYQLGQQKYQQYPSQLQHEQVASPNSEASHGSHHSAAFRNAQELLRKNRRRRQEQQMQHQHAISPPNGQEYSSFRDPLSPDTEGDDSAWDSGSEISGSNVSGSSLWSDNSGTDRSSRRALILQMAKARMRNNKDSPSKSLGGGTPLNRPFPPRIDEEGGSLGGHSEYQSDIDMAGDLD